MGSRDKVPVFATTSLGNNIAIDVPPNVTARELKSEVERAHFNCFPKVGGIRANGVLVKRKSFFYHLPDSLPIKHAFQGVKGTWFIHIEVCAQKVSDLLGFSESHAAEIRDQISNSCKITDSDQPEINLSSANKNKNNSCRFNGKGTERIPHLKSEPQLAFGTVHLSKRKKRKRVKKNHFLHPTVEGLEEGHSVGNGGDIATESTLSASITVDDRNEAWKSNALSDNPETLSETLSVSGIIKKYFSDYEEVTFCPNYTYRANKSRCREQMTAVTDVNCSEAEASGMPRFTPKTPPISLPSMLTTDISCKTSRNKIRRPEVGKRLVVASNKLSMSASMGKSATGLCGRGDRKLLVPKFSSLVRSIVFEVGDNDE